jgi:hypothetical protein
LSNNDATNYEIEGVYDHGATLAEVCRCCADGKMENDYNEISERVGGLIDRNIELEYKVKQLTIKNGNLISLIKDIACNVGDVLKAAERM